MKKYVTVPAGQGTQKRKGQKNARSGLTSTPTPPPKVEEQVQDVVPPKSNESAIEKEIVVDIAPKAPEVESVPEVFT